MSAVTDARILADVQAGNVTQSGPGEYHPPSDVDTGLLGEYRTRLHLLVTARVWVMDSGKRTKSGGKVLCLTSIGEHVLRVSNPDRYRSRNAIEARDGQYRAEAVTR